MVALEKSITTSIPGLFAYGLFILSLDISKTLFFFPLMCISKIMSKLYKHVRASFTLMGWMLDGLSQGRNKYKCLY